jgi:hypothetical protein
MPIIRSLSTAAAASGLPIVIRDNFLIHLNERRKFILQKMKTFVIFYTFKISAG